MLKKCFTRCVTAAIGILAVSAYAQTLAPPRRFESTHEASIAGHKLRYKAIVAEYFVCDPAGRRAASLIATSYLRIDGPKDASRPVVFVFNGGPGSASLWLHLGIAGPKRVDLPDALNPPTTAPFRLVDDEESPLDVADIVLIDPPGTGFSRVLAEGKPENFFGVAQDAQTTVNFIEQWLRDHGRWNAPKFLLSESYGTVRAAVVARLLTGGPTSTGRMDGITLNGVILLGQDLDLSRAAGKDGRRLNELPTLAAVACYHHRVSDGCSVESQVTAAKQFAASEYATALLAGHALSAADRDRVADRLSGLVGLRREVVIDHDLRISTQDFMHLLLEDHHQDVGAYDGRYVLPSQASGNDPVADDPAMGQYVPAFVATFNDYMRRDLVVTIDEPYQAIAFRDVNAHWDWGQGPGVGPTENYAVDLATAMRRNSRLRLMIGSGYFDLVTPLGEAAYTLSHSDIPPSATEVHLYPSGHMLYLGDDARRALARDLRAFLKGR